MNINSLPEHIQVSIVKEFSKLLFNDLEVLLLNPFSEQGPNFKFLQSSQFPEFTKPLIEFLVITSPVEFLKECLRKGLNFPNTPKVKSLLLDFFGEKVVKSQTIEIDMPEFTLPQDR